VTRPTERLNVAVDVSATMGKRNNVIDVYSGRENEIPALRATRFTGSLDFGAKSSGSVISACQQRTTLAPCLHGRSTFIGFIMSHTATPTGRERVTVEAGCSQGHSMTHLLTLVGGLISRGSGIEPDLPECSGG